MLERVWRKGSPYTPLMGMHIGTAAMENSMAIPQNISTYDPAILLLHVHPKELKARTQKDTCTPMLISATSHNNQKVETI